MGSDPAGSVGRIAIDTALGCLHSALDLKPMFRSLVCHQGNERWSCRIPAGIGNGNARNADISPPSGCVCARTRSRDRWLLSRIPPSAQAILQDRWNVQRKVQFAMLSTSSTGLHWWMHEDRQWPLRCQGGKSCRIVTRIRTSSLHSMEPGAWIQWFPLSRCHAATVRILERFLGDSWRIVKDCEGLWRIVEVRLGAQVGLMTKTRLWRRRFLIKLRKWGLVLYRLMDFFIGLMLINFRGSDHVSINAPFFLVTTRLDPVTFPFSECFFFFPFLPVPSFSPFGLERKWEEEEEEGEKEEETRWNKYLEMLLPRSMVSRVHYLNNNGFLGSLSIRWIFDLYFI